MACISGDIYTSLRWGGNKQQKPLHTTGLGISGLGGGGEPMCLGFGLSLDRLHLIPDRTLFYFVCVVFFGSKHVQADLQALQVAIAPLGKKQLLCGVAPMLGVPCWPLSTLFSSSSQNLWSDAEGQGTGLGKSWLSRGGGEPADATINVLSKLMDETITKLQREVKVNRIHVLIVFQIVFGFLGAGQIKHFF